MEVIILILFDLSVYQFILNIFPPTTLMTVIMKLITSFGSALFIISCLISIAVLVRNKKYFKIFFFAILGGVIFNNLMKLIIQRPRPTNTLLLSYEKTYSFPSGHSMMSMIFYGLLIYYVILFVKNKLIRNLLVSFFSLLILFIGISRIYLGVHYVTDVLAGFVFGFIFLVCFIKFLKKEKSVKI